MTENLPFRPICDMLLDQDRYIGTDPVGHHCTNTATHIFGGSHFICDECERLLAEGSPRVTIPTTGSAIGWADRMKAILEEIKT